LAEGEPLPAIKTLAKKYNVAFGTAQRAVSLLADAGHVTIRPGRRTIVGPAVTGTPADRGTVLTSSSALALHLPGTSVVKGWRNALKCGLGSLRRSG
jgi:DNA-binding GntR family transcriptional regulator